MTTPRPRLMRSALVGLLLGILFSGLLLFVLALRTQREEVDCPPEAFEECVLERQIALEWSRTQVVVGLALTLLGFGGLLWQRSVERRQGAAAQQPTAEG